MKITANSTPQLIVEKWRSKLNTAEDLMNGIEDARLKDVPITSSLTQLRNTHVKLKLIYAAALGRAKYEANCSGRFKQYLYTFSGTALDLSLEAVTAYLWQQALNSEDLSPKNAIALAVSTLLSTVASKVKDRIWTRLEEHVKAVADMEEIIPNKRAIKHVKAMLAIYERGEASRPSISALESAKNDSDSVKVDSRLRLVARSVIERKRSEAEVARKDELRKLAVVRFCKYSRLDGSTIDNLSQEFSELKQRMLKEEDIIEEELKKDPTTNVMAFINILEKQVAEMRIKISDADMLISIQADIEKTRSRFIRTGFRISAQLLLELGSLVSAIIEVFDTYFDKTSYAVKVTGVSFYIFNIVLSWINTAFSKEEETKAKKLQGLKRISSQLVYVERVEGMVVEEKRITGNGAIGASGSAKSLELSDSLMDRPPVVGMLGSALRREVLRLYDMKGAPKGKARAMTVDELSVPARKSYASSSPLAQRNEWDGISVGVGAGVGLGAGSGAGLGAGSGAGSGAASGVIIGVGVSPRAIAAAGRYPIEVVVDGSTAIPMLDQMFE